MSWETALFCCVVFNVWRYMRFYDEEYMTNVMTTNTNLTAAKTAKKDE